MKQRLRKLFFFILNPFESGNKQFVYQKSHRLILIAVATLFTGLGTIVAYLAEGQDSSYYFPAVIFLGIALVAFVIGFLGNDRAVATIWGNTDRK